jgi:hypothetical protein
MSKQNNIMKNSVASIVDKKMKKMMSKEAEVKVCDTYRAYTTIHATSPLRDDLCLIAQGSAVYERNAITIRPFKFELNLFVNPNTSAVTSCRVRVLLVQSKIGEVTVPSASDILDDVLGNIGSQQYIMSQRNFPRKHQYNVMKQEDVIIGPKGYYGDKRSMHWNVNVPAAIVEFKDASSSIASNIRGRMYLFVLTEEPNSSSEQPSIAFHARLHYTDV